MTRQERSVSAETVPRRERGSTAVYEEMREDILTLKAAPGSAIDEVTLANRFGLSRTPIREALLMLGKEDLVKFLPGRSAIVAPHEMNNAREYMDTLILLSRAVVHLAAVSRTEIDIERIRVALSAYENAADSTDLIVAFDLAFHRAISAAGHNDFLDRFYRLTLDYGRRMMLLYYYPHIEPAERAERCDDHRQLFDAIEIGDGAKCETIIARHLVSELGVIQRALEPDFGQRFNLDLQYRNPE